MNAVRLLARLASAFALITLSLAPAAWAQSEAAAQPTQIAMSAPARAAKGHLTLRATLSTSDGKPVGDKSISFYQQVELFGGRDALLGTATTDSTGFGAIDYQPSETGSQTIKVRFAGNAQLASTETVTNIDVREATPLYTPEPLPLASVRQWLPLGLASLVLATWAVLIGITLRTIRGVRSIRPIGEQTTAHEPVLAYAQTIEGSTHS